MNKYNVTGFYKELFIFSDCSLYAITNIHIYFKLFLRKRVEDKFVINNNK